MPPPFFKAMPSDHESATTLPGEAGTALSRERGSGGNVEEADEAEAAWRREQSALA